MGNRRTPLERAVLVALAEAQEESIHDLLLILRHEHQVELDVLGLHELARSLARLTTEGVILAGRDLRDGDWLVRRLARNTAGDWQWSSQKQEPVVTLTDLGVQALDGHVG